MSGSSQDESFIDVSERAQTTLDYIIAGKEEKRAAQKAAQMPVSQALSGDQVVHFDSSRTKARILFISSDHEALKDASWLEQHATSVSTVFEEVHVAVLMNGKKREYPTKRIGNNIWMYTVNFSSTWFFSQTIERFAETQLQFLDGFRPDVIVALDPFYAGKAAEYLAKRYDRPLQIHVLKDFLAPSFIEQGKENKSKVTIARQVLKRAKSVRTNSSLLKDKLEKAFPRIEDLGTLPRHFDTDTLIKQKRSNVLKQKYPEYVFIVLTAGVLDQNSTIFRTMDAARSMLFSPRIGLVIVGDGPMRAELQERANLLGIKEQVVFETDYTVLNDYMLSADMFVCTDTSAIGDEYIIQAAAAGLPIVMARTPLREDLFVDGTSALLCDADDTVGFTQKMNSILNTNAFRLQYSTNARQVVKDRLHTDPEMYKVAYRDSIEVVFGNGNFPAPRNEVADEADMPTLKRGGEAPTINAAAAA